MKKALKLRVGQQIENYTIYSKDEHAANGSVALPVAEGGSSSVYRAKFKGKLARALKVLNPTLEDEGRIPGGMDSFKRSFEREVGLLSRINHTNIAPITDFGELTIDDESHLYLATAWIEGRRIDDQLIGGTYDAEAVLSALKQLFDGVAHLHARSILHADLDAKNLFLHSSEDDLTPTILDLGVSKVIDPDQLGGSTWTDPNRPAGEGKLFDDDQNSTYFFTSKRICPERWSGLVATRVERTELAKLFPAYDLYGLSVLLEDLLDNASMAARLMDGLGPSGVSGLRTVAGKLGSLREGYDIDDAREDLEKLSPKFAAPFGIVELSIASPLSRSVSTAQGLTAVTRNLDQLIKHPLVQRLSSIPQLEFVDRTYSGATQSRLAHAISTFRWARLYVAHLLADSRFRMEVRATELQALLLWSLLHDLGHFPLSHMFEDLAEEHRGDGGPLQIPTDDDLFWIMMELGQPGDRQAFGDVSDALQYAWDRDSDGFSKPYGESLRRQITDFYGDAVYGDMIAIGGYLSKSQGEPGTAASVLAAIISSPIDADKMAYLKDDSFYTGVSFGAGVDAQGLMASLRMPPEGVVSGPVPVIGVEAAGQSAAESLVLARHWMVRRVYWHRTNRAVMAMVKHMIVRLMRAEKFRFSDYLQANLFGSRETGLLYLSRAFESAPKAIQESSGGEVVDTTGLLLTGHADSYFRVLTVSQSVDEELYSKLEGLSSVRLQIVCDELVLWLNQEKKLSIRLGELLIDAPRKNRSGIAGAGGGHCFIVDEGPVTSAELLEKKSVTLVGMDRQRAKKARVFLHPRHRMDRWVTDSGLWEEMRRQIAARVNPQRQP